MRLDLTDMLHALSFALDKVEAELLGIDTGHGRRVAAISLLMGEAAGFNKEELRDFVGCCLLHDSALVEFIREELSNSVMSEDLHVDLFEIATKSKSKMHRDHSVIGEQNMRLLPFRTDVKNVVLYHHENADGTGILRMTAAQTPLKAQILHLVDSIDTASHLHLETMTMEEYETLCEWVKSKTGSMFSPEASALFFQGVTYDKIALLQEKRLLFYLHDVLYQEMVDYNDEEIHNIAKFLANIIDYKSEFTEYHSMGVAEKAELMARHCGFDQDKTLRFFFAGAMHDIGKLMVTNGILEKPGKLTDDEFTEMKHHAAGTRYILSQIKGIDDIVSWASNHHEKLNGKGYPRGLTAQELSFEDQLMACIDIYQARTEKRPYKDGMSHEKAISILKDMAGRGELNAHIVHDLDLVMGSACQSPATV